MTTVIKGQATTLVSYAPIPYPPTSITVRVQTPAVGLPAEADAVPATAEGTTGTTNADASRGDRTLAFASDPGFVPGRKYGVEQDGHRFVVVVEETGSTVYLQSPLPTDIASGATVFALAVTIALSADDTATAGLEGLAKWRATLNGAAYDWDQHFAVVDERMPIPIDAADLQHLWPQSRRRQASADFDLSGLMAAAWELYVVPELESRGIRPDLINNTEPLKPVMVHAAKLVAYEQSNPGDIGAIEAHQRRFVSAVNLATARRDWWAAESDDEDTQAEIGQSAATGRIKRVY